MAIALEGSQITGWIGVICSLGDIFHVSCHACRGSDGITFFLAVGFGGVYGCVTGGCIVVSIIFKVFKAKSGLNSGCRLLLLTELFPVEKGKELRFITNEETIKIEQKQKYVIILTLLKRRYVIEVYFASMAGWRRREVVWESI